MANFLSFQNLNSFLFGFNGKNSYYKSPHIPSYHINLNGAPEWIDVSPRMIFGYYETTAHLAAVIDRKGHLLSSGIWKHYRKDANGDKVLIENSELVNVLENPNALMDGNTFLMEFNRNVCLYGVDYTYLNRPYASALPAQMTNLINTEVKVKTTGKYYKQSKIEDIIQYYQICDAAGDEIDKLEPTKEVTYYKISNGENAIVPLSPLKPIYMQLSNLRAAYKFRNVIMTKRGALGIFSNSSGNSVTGALPLKEDERRRIEKEVTEGYGIGDDEMKMIFSNAGLTYQNISYPTKDLMLFEEVDDDFRAIIDHYGLNINIFSKDKGATFENLKEGIKQAYQSTVIPYAESIALYFSKDVFGLDGKTEWLELDYSHITVLQEDESERADIDKKKAETIKILKETEMYSDDELKEIIRFE